MKTLFKNGLIFTRKGFEKKDFYISDNKITIVNGKIDFSDFSNVVNCSNKYIVPGFVDVHVHLREPGFFYKETIKTGSEAAAKGGYTVVCSMPNLNPAPSDFKNLKRQLDIINKDALIKVIPYGTITANQSGEGALSAMEEMADYVIAFSDDGRGVQAKKLMKEAMLKAKSLNKPIVAHCEDETLINQGYIHEGEYALKNNHRGICSKSEWIQVERDIELARETGCQYHVCHVSTKESVELIRKAKKEGLRVSGETAPHYLTLTDNDLKESGNYKMNPPIRSFEDKSALIEGIKDGTIEVIATDHAPHSLEEKSKGLKDSLFGIVGLETCFQVLYTELVKQKVISLEDLINLMAINPRKLFNLKEVYIDDDYPADFTILDLDRRSVIDCETFVSKGKATPFNGKEVEGMVIKTYYQGKEVYSLDK